MGLPFSLASGSSSWGGGCFIHRHVTTAGRQGPPWWLTELNVFSHLNLSLKELIMLCF